MFFVILITNILPQVYFKRVLKMCYAVAFMEVSLKYEFMNFINKQMCIIEINRRHDDDDDIGWCKSNCGFGS